jgi:hypothetical protein
MKTITKTRIYLPMTALIVTAALAVAASQNQVPFKGAMQGHDVDNLISPTIVVVTTTGTGVGTQLGQFSFTQQGTVNLEANTESGFTHWVAANGDTIDTTLVGTGGPTDTPDVLSITEVHTITGGSGRFAGAQGSFTVERMANTVTFLTSGSFHGVISSPGATH